MAAPVGFLDFQIVGSERGVQGMLERVDSALSHVGLGLFLHEAVAPWVIERAKNRFANEGDDVTGRWKPLAETTVAWRESSGFEGSHPINKRTGELEAYITESQVGIAAMPGAGASLTYPKDPPKTPGLKKKMETAQKGRTSPKTEPRPVLGLGEKDLGQVMTMLAFFIQKGGSSRGL